VDGPHLEDYERLLAGLIGVDHALSFWAGRMGLYGILRCLDIGPGDEVLLQVPTHVVVANAVRYSGATPVYVDCRLDTFNMDLERAESQVTGRTRAVIIQHSFGIPADLDAVLALAARHRLLVIEDCVHSLGSTYGGRPVGGFGVAGFFSTEETKTISSTMGGAVVTGDPRLAARLREFQRGCAAPSRRQTSRYLLKLVAYHLLTAPSVHGVSRWLYERAGRRNPLPRATTPEELQGERPDGYEKRFSNAQAELAARQLRRLDGNLRHRRRVAALYREALAPLGFSLPEPPAGADPVYVRFPVLVSDREAAMRAARPHAVLGNWFTSVLEEAVTSAVCGYVPGSCPRAEAAAEHLVNLPTNPSVKGADVARLVTAMAEITPWGPVSAPSPPPTSAQSG
jgi:dTDP-4-amino-4,6-dideoxygalactose transaminase